MCRNDSKPAFQHVRPAKIQISLRICAVWSEYSQDAFWIAKDAKYLHVENEDWILYIHSYGGKILLQTVLLLIAYFPWHDK